MRRAADGRGAIESGNVERLEQAAGLTHLSPVWAKLEIVLGLAAATFGLKLLLNEGVVSIAGGALVVLGLYLASAGNRSHLYQSQNRQTAFLCAVMRTVAAGDVPVKLTAGDPAHRESHPGSRESPP